MLRHAHRRTQCCRTGYLSRGEGQARGADGLGRLLSSPATLHSEEPGKMPLSVWTLREQLEVKCVTVCASSLSDWGGPEPLPSGRGEPEEGLDSGHDNMLYIMSISFLNKDFKLKYLFGFTSCRFQHSCCCCTSKFRRFQKEMSFCFFRELYLKKTSTINIKHCIENTQIRTLVTEIQNITVFESPKKKMQSNQCLTYPRL